MKAGKYSVKELFINRYVQQIIIPEIQRDYVWGEEQVIGLLNSIKKDFELFKTAQTPKIETPDNDLKIAFETFYKKRNNGSNIGFIYAYNDDQYSGNYFLIDGQQRITTIFLMLLVLASKNERLKEKFKKAYLTDGLLKLDYKVRESAHNFLQQFTALALKGNTDFTNQNWYYSNKYDSDTTIQSLIANFHSIQEYYENNLPNNLEAFYEYIEDYVEFWYFDTNISEQGEELYIYMNARGEQMQANENIKADLLSKLDTTEEKNKYGKLWEDWQDYFWVNRGNNENADKGFNEFLSCLAGFKINFIDEKGNFYSKEKFEKESKINTSDLLKSLNLKYVESGMNVIRFLLDNRDAFTNSYNYTNWLKDFIDEIWNLFNDNKTNWYADFRDQNRATERNRMVFLWSIFYYVKTMLEKSYENNHDEIVSTVFRFIRMFYLRYHNYNRSVSTLRKTIDLILINGVFDNAENSVVDTVQSENVSEDLEDNNFKSLTSEEQIRARFYQKYLGNQQLLRQYEEILWKIEDHKFNLNGRDVGSTNFSHFINLEQEYDIDKLQLIANKFYEVFPLKAEEYKIVQSILLFYGQYWRRVSPNYYRNYKFNDWRRVIRNLCIAKENGDEPFKKFFFDFLSYDNSLYEFLNKKRNTYDNKVAYDLREKLIHYNIKYEEQMWKEGNHIAISIGQYCSLPDWSGRDKLFSDDYIIYNIDTNLKGGNKQELSQIL